MVFQETNMHCRFHYGFRVYSASICRKGSRMVTGSHVSDTDITNAYITDGNSHGLQDDISEGL